MIARATVEALIDRALETQARVDRGEVDGRDPAVQAECGEVLATIDAYLAELPEATRAETSRALAARLAAPPVRYTATVPPKRRTIVRAGEV